MKWLLIIAALMLPYGFASARPVKPIPEKQNFCRMILQGMAFNFYLDEKCKYGGNIAAKCLLLYYGADCHKEFSQEIHDSLKNEARLDGETRYLKYGKKTFCQVNRKGLKPAEATVDALMDEYYPPADMLTEEQKREREEDMEKLVNELGVEGIMGSIE